MVLRVSVHGFEVCFATLQVHGVVISATSYAQVSNK